MLPDGVASLRQHPTEVALSQRRVAAAPAMADVAGRLGRVDESVQWLRALARDEALNEALHARLMLALAASGEQAAALRVYADLRDRLGEELGIGPGAELQDAHVRVLRQDYDRGVVEVAPCPALAQLPATGVSIRAECDFGVMSDPASRFLSTMDYMSRATTSPATEASYPPPGRPSRQCRAPSPSATLTVCHPHRCHLTRPAPVKRRPQTGQPGRGHRRCHRHRQAGAT